MHTGTDHDQMYYADETGVNVIGPYPLEGIEDHMRARYRLGWPDHMVWNAIAPNIDVARTIIHREVVKLGRKKS